jgi:hypothetical protein
MAHIIIEKFVAAPIDQAYASWAEDFGDIQKFHPQVTSSFSINNSPANGLGAERKCNLDDGKSWVKERVIEAKENERLTLVIFDSNVPVKDAQLALSFSSSDKGTNVTLAFTFTAAIPIIGKLMEPLMKKKFTQALTGLLDGNAEYLLSQAKAAA